MTPRTKAGADLLRLVNREPPIGSLPPEAVRAIEDEMLDEVAAYVNDLTDYPRFDDDDEFTDGWRAVKDRVSRAIEDIRKADR